MRRGLDFVVGLQLPFGGIAWARDADGTVNEDALLAGSSSIYQALAPASRSSELMDDPQPTGSSPPAGSATRCASTASCSWTSPTFSMDWYYPVLGGAVRGDAARALLDSRWDDFVVPGLGIRCVDTNPWVTGAETCELALALDALGDRDRAPGCSPTSSTSATRTAATGPATSSRRRDASGRPSTRRTPRPR